MKIFKIQFFLITLLSLFSFQTINASGLEYIKVETEGTGVSVREAIDSALIQAIERVNGKSMESSTLLKTTEKLEETNKDSNYYSSQEYQDEIKSKTKGQIKEYKILSQNQMPDTSLWVVRVNATIAKYKVSKSAKRKRIAVLPLQARPDCCNMIGVGTNPVFASEELSRGLIENFFSTLQSNYLEVFQML